MPVEARPYCKLYDEGYTSLGSTLNTIPNPKLMQADGSFSPAYMLTDGADERGGRISKQRKDKMKPPMPSPTPSAELPTWLNGAALICFGIGVGAALAKRL